MNPCACRDCMDLTAGVPGSRCWKCADCGCYPYSIRKRPYDLQSYECQRPDAYDVDAEFERDQWESERGY